MLFRLLLSSIIAVGVVTEVAFAQTGTSSTPGASSSPFPAGTSPTGAGIASKSGSAVPPDSSGASGATSAKSGSPTSLGDPAQPAPDSRATTGGDANKAVGTSGG
jgi:hypothetical protein